jgi:hypothetical protein
MSANLTAPPRIEDGRFRTRSADADWDFFPFGRWGRGYRVSEAERERVRRLEGRLEIVRFAIWVLISATLLLATGEALGFATAFVSGGCMAFLLTKLGFLWVVARQTRHLARAERPLTWTELQEWETATMSLPRIVLAILVGVAMTIGGAVLFSLTAADVDVQRRWFGIIGSAVLLAIGVYCACRFADVLRRHLGRRQEPRAR